MNTKINFELKLEYWHPYCLNVPFYPVAATERVWEVGFISGRRDRMSFDRVNILECTTVNNVKKKLDLHLRRNGAFK